MKVAVIGAGAVGLGLSSCLLASGASVHLQVRDPRAADALRGEGLTRTGIFGNFHAPAGTFTVGTSLSELANAEPASVLVCTKTTAVDEVAGVLAEVWPSLPSPLVVLCHNGWGSAERFARQLPKQRAAEAGGRSSATAASPSCVTSRVSSAPAFSSSQSAPPPSSGLEFSSSYLSC